MASFVNTSRLNMHTRVMCKVYGRIYIYKNEIPEIAQFEMHEKYSVNIFCQKTFLD